ncbi:MAG TPA: hypothetical protein VD884_19105 [Ohtaekwangia sp.]|nr:hypothetical protein [Ohtaekwangia sp.]
MEILYTADNLHISYDPDTRIMFCKWVGHQPKKVIQQCGLVMIRLLKERKVEKILNDNTEVSGPWMDAAEWTAHEWFPEIIGAGLKHFAWVLSRNIFAELSAIEAMPASQVVCTFHSVPEAYGWLKAQSFKKEEIDL